MVESRSIQGVLVVILVAILAAWLGVSVVTNQTDTLMKVGGAALLILCLLLGKRIWLLLVFFGALNVPLIRGFGTVELGQSLFICFSAAIFMLRRLDLKVRFGELEIWMILIALMVVQVYLRNPVGLSLFGASSVGARPYFMIAMAWASGLILGSLVVPAGDLRWAMKLALLGAIAGLFLSGLRSRLFGGGPVASGIESAATAGGSTRISSLGNLGVIISRWVSSHVSPLRACFHPFWAPLILFSLVAAAASGFRNNVAAVGLTYLVGIAYRGGGVSVVISVIGGAVGLGVLALFNLVSPLPPNIQRALSPFPGTWEERHVKAADESTEWRVEMWKEALFTPHWIENKILGDGLGFSRREHQMLMALEEGGSGFASLNSGLSVQQETMMLTGGYHNGPVQTIRAVGYVGLMILLLAMIRLAVHSHRQVKRCQGTDWYPFALFFGIPTVVGPIFFTFIFGEFGAAAAAFCGSYGIIRLMETNLPLPAYAKPQRGPYILKPRHLAAMRTQGQPG